MPKARTVTGDVPADELGTTLPHEHTIVDHSDIRNMDDDAPEIDKELSQSEPTLENRWWFRENSHSSPNNAVVDDVDLLVKETQRFRDRGGDTIVDVSSFGLGSDPEALREISSRTGLNLIVGTGYYTANTYPPDMDDKTVEEIADEIVAEIEEGIDDTGIQAGIIGEIGASDGFLENENEVKSFRGAALAQQRTGAPITIHTPIWSPECHDIIDVLEEGGADLENVVLGHMDGTIRTDDAVEYHSSLASRGPYIEFDLFGSEWYFESADVVLPLDHDKIDHICSLHDEGVDDILISQDICLKMHLTKYGGFGYDYILRNIIPRFRNRGVNESDIDRLLVENPKEVLGFV